MQGHGKSVTRRGHNHSRLPGATDRAGASAKTAAAGIALAKIAPAEIAPAEIGLTKIGRG
jgi:hypothetical protein